MDDRPSRRTSFDGAAQRVRRSVSAKANRHTWADYNGSLSSSASISHPHKRLSLRRSDSPEKVSSRSRVVKSHSAPSSRSPSPGPRPSSRSSVPNFSRVLPFRTPILSTIMENRSAIESAESLRRRLRSSNIMRWDPSTRTTTPWDSLRRDSELWYDNGDCLVHLYAKGHSKRGPALRLPLDSIGAENLSAIFRLCYVQVPPDTLHHDDKPSSAPNVYNVFIPAPDHETKDAAFRWHLTTRNFFAFLFGKPLVGIQLGKTLVDLQERIHFFRPGNPDNHSDFMTFLENLGYLEFAHCPDYSLALLYFAEHYEIKEQWTDAFAHCVGMNKMLNESSEYWFTSRITQHLITNAYLKQEIHLAEVGRALSNFLEDQLSSANLGLSQGARIHLDHFRSFLHTYYIEKFNYWPPPRSTFPKPLYRAMYFDFRNLYDLLVDLESTDSLQDQRPASGGICVLQNVQAFDQRHKYLPLPHPLPLLPENVDDQLKRQSQLNIFASRLGAKQAKSERYMAIKTALSDATNSSNASLMSSKIVKAYLGFERAWIRKHEEKVSVRDARKVRWLLIYGCLQMLVAALRAPKEVKDVDSPTYALCCLVPSALPWTADTKALIGPHEPSINFPGATDGSDMEKPLPATPELSIHPDCETDDYFSNAHAGKVVPFRERPITSAGTKAISSSTKITSSRSATNLIRNASVRSMKRLSFVARRNSIVKPPTANFCEILVHGYGNGLNKTILDPPKIRTSYSWDEPVSPYEITVSHQSPAQDKLDQDLDAIVMPLRIKPRPTTLVIHEADIPEEQTLRHLEHFNNDTGSDAVLSDDALAVSSSETGSESRTPPESSRSTSPTSGSSQEELPTLIHSGVTRNSSVTTSSATLSPLTPVDQDIDREIQAPIIRRSMSLDRFVLEETANNDAQHILAYSLHSSIEMKEAKGNEVSVHDTIGLSLSKHISRKRESIRMSFMKTSRPKGEWRRSLGHSSLSNGDIIEALAESMPA